MLIVKQQLDLPYKVDFPIFISLSISEIFVEKKISSYHHGEVEFLVQIWLSYGNSYSKIYTYTYKHIYIYVFAYI